MKSLKTLAVSFVNALLVASALAWNVQSALAQTAALVPNAKQQFFNANGDPLAGGSVYSYVPNTTTPKTTWIDPFEATPNANPVVLDAGGGAFIFGQGNYRQVVKDAQGNLIWDGFTAAYGSSTPSGSNGTDTAPVGTVMPYAGSAVPVNWQLAYGQALSRTTFAQLETAITISTSTGNATSTSTTISGFANTSQVPVGSPIECSCLPTGTTVASITNATTLVVSQAATATGSFSVTVFPWGNGDGVTTFNVPDLRGRTFAGADAMGGTAASRLTSAFYGASASTPGVAGGAQSHTASTTLVQANLPSYTLPNSLGFSGNQITPSVQVNVAGTPIANGLGGASGNLQFQAGAGGTASSGALFAQFTPSGNITGSVTSGGSGTAATSASFATIQPTLTVNYIIKVAPNTTGAGGVVSFGGMFGDIVCDSTLVCAPVANVNTVGCAIATTSQRGCVTPDGTTITVSGTGVISAATIVPNITVGTTIVTGGSNGNLLNITTGKVGVVGTTGSGNVVLATSPTLSGTVAGNITLSGNDTLSGNVSLTGLATGGTLSNALCATSAGSVQLSAASTNCFPAALAVGSSTVTGGTSGNIEFNNAGVLGEITPTGTGNVVLAASPTLSGTIGGNLTFSGNVVHSGATTLNSTLTAPSLLTSGTISGSICSDASGHIIYNATTNCFAVAASAIAVGTTSVTGGTSGNIEFNNGGTLGEKSVTGSGSVVLATSGTLTTPTLSGTVAGTYTLGGTPTYTNLPKATTGAFGVVEGDNATITLTAGVISCTTATTSVLGCVKPDGTTVTISGGIISSNAAATSIHPGVTTVVSGTSGDVEYNNAGVLGELPPWVQLGSTQLSLGNTFSTIGGPITWSGIQTHTAVVFMQATGTPSPASNGDAYLASSTTNGGLLLGKGSVNDLALYNAGTNIVCATPTGTLNWNCNGNMTATNSFTGTSASSCFYLDNGTANGLCFPNVTPTPGGGNESVVSLLESGTNIAGSNKPSPILDISTNNSLLQTGRHLATLDSNWIDLADNWGLESFNDQLQPGSIGFGGTWVNGDVAAVVVSWNYPPAGPNSVTMTCTVGSTCNGAWGSGTSTAVIAGYFNNQFNTNATLLSAPIYSDPNDVIANFPSAGFNGFGYLTTARIGLTGLSLAATGKVSSAGTEVLNNPATVLDGPVGVLLYREPPVAAAFTGSQSGTTLTVSAISSGCIGVGMAVVESTFVEHITGGPSCGGTGSYTTDTVAAVGSTSWSAYRPPVSGDLFDQISFLGPTAAEPAGGVTQAVISAYQGNPATPTSFLNFTTQCAGGGGASNQNGCLDMVIGGSGGGTVVGAPVALNSGLGHEFEVWAKSSTGGNVLSVTGNVEFTNSMTIFAESQSGSASENLELRGSTVFAYGTLNAGGCSYNGSGTSWSCTSDARVKKDFATLANATSKLAQLHPVSFALKLAHDGKRHDGFTAQDVQRVFPELVQNSGLKSPLTPDGQLTLDYTGLVPWLVQAVDELSARVHYLESRRK